MSPETQSLISDFVQVARLSGMPITTEDVGHERLCAPHRQPPLPSGRMAAYVFSLAAQPSVVLKVGKAGPNSNARFQSQHYIAYGSKSNLAKSILENPDAWPKLRIQNIDSQTVGDWIKRNACRDHFFLSADKPPGLLHLLEAFLQCRLKPMFEG